VLREDKEPDEMLLIFRSKHGFFIQRINASAWQFGAFGFIQMSTSATNRKYLFSLQ